MFKKLLSGEFGLGETFWKFGIFGVLVVHFFVRIFEFLLQKQIGNLRIVDYYLHYFNPIKFNGWAIFFTLCLPMASAKRCFARVAPPLTSITPPLAPFKRWGRGFTLKLSFKGAQIRAHSILPLKS